MDIPIVRWTDPGSGEIKENMVFCTDILDALTQDFFARKGNPIDEPPHVDEIKVNLKLICFRKFSILYHFIKEFEKKTRHGCATWKVCANCILMVLKQENFHYVMEIAPLRTPLPKWE